MSASRIVSVSKGEMKVLTASRSIGGVAIIERSRTPVRANWSVRGIGVAESVSTWMWARSSFSRSLCFTPKCCSSSTIKRPRSLNSIPLPSSAWVPMAISVVPSAMPFLTRASSAEPTRREAWPISIGSPRKRSWKVRVCWRASSVVGAISATCLPFMAATKAARSATSVLPKPTSPQIEAVHRAAGLQVVEGRLDRRHLVVRLLVGEAGGELVVEPGGRRQRRGGARQPRGGGLDQLLRHVADALLQPRLARLPADAAELVEIGGGALRAVAGQELDVLHRQEQAVVAGVEDLQAIVRRARRLDGAQAGEAADAMVDVHDEIAGREARHFGQRIGGALAPAAGAHEPVAEHVLVADDGNVGRLEAGLEAKNGEARRALRKRLQRRPSSPPASGSGAHGRGAPGPSGRARPRSRRRA